jgi:hypothetical protein
MCQLKSISLVCHKAEILVVCKKKMETFFMHEITSSFASKHLSEPPPPPPEPYPTPDPQPQPTPEPVPEPSPEPNPEPEPYQ